MVEGENPSWPARCRSCDAELHGPYCSACGESHVHGRLDLRALIEQALEGLVNLDTRVLRTIGELTVAPAKVCRDYLDGRRVQYVNPFKYALASYTFAVLVAEFLVWRNGLPTDPVDAKIAMFQLRWGMLTNFLAMPLLATLLWLLFLAGARRLRWVEHLVLVLFAFGHVVLLQGLIAPLVWEARTVGAVVFGLLPPLMLCWVALGVYEARWWTTILRALLAFAVMQAAVFSVILALAR